MHELWALFNWFYVAQVSVQSRRMPMCAFDGCKNITSRALKKHGISYFHFPRDPIRCGEWAAIVSLQRRREYRPNNSSVICSEHFSDEDMYITDKGIKRLLKTSNPRVAIEELGDRHETVRLEKSSMFDSEKKKELITPIFSVGSTPESFQEELLKNQLSKYREKLISKEKLLANLKRKNFRLVEKTTRLKNALKVLRRRLRLKSYTNK